MKLEKTAIFISILLGGMLTTVVPACASSVTFYTTGTFSAGTTSGTLTYTDGANSVSYCDTVAGAVTPANCTLSPSTINSPGGSATIGYFNASIAPNTSITAAGTFELTINQTLPPGVGTYNDSFSGTITAGNLGSHGELVVDFTNTSVTIDGATYVLENLQCKGDVKTNGCVQDELAISPTFTTVSAFVTPAVPEPGYYALTGIGLVGVFSLVLRRKRRNAVS